MADRLQLESVAGDGSHAVIVRGEVDMESSPRLLAALQLGLRLGGGLVVDLEGVSYIDSSGIAVLIQGLKAANQRRQPFRLRRPSKQVNAVLQLAQLQQLFAIDDGGPGGG
jgi:anti-sigma B factor antagonist